MRAYSSSGIADNHDRYNSEQGPKGIEAGVTRVCQVRGLWSRLGRWSLFQRSWVQWRGIPQGCGCILEESTQQWRWGWRICPKVQWREKLINTCRRASWGWTCSRHRTWQIRARILGFDQATRGWGSWSARVAPQETRSWGDWPVHLQDLSDRIHWRRWRRWVIRIRCRWDPSTVSLWAHISQKLPSELPKVSDWGVQVSSGLPWNSLQGRDWRSWFEGVAFWCWLRKVLNVCFECSCWH